ncbi:hypothetical protein M231_00179 [Tremella mesenterica]|uniref:Transcriptional regulatory protein RXT2 N-terminal domain-containing protein n=1 Tax=Tremella mesenterica TaxID=5217 RepID=A0A4Q1BWR7_TREME|nr:hypothetical protein M231_00179 [Tremella mesenterica]
MPPTVAHHAGARYTTNRRDPKLAVNAKELECLPSMDSRAYYDIPSSPSTSSDDSDSPPPPPSNLLTNSGNKLIPGARFMRKGKLYAWSQDSEDTTKELRARKRLQNVLEQIMPEAATEVGAPIPQNSLDRKSKRDSKKRKRAEEKSFLLPHLVKSPSPPASTTKLAPLLAAPNSYLELMMNDALKHSLGDDTTERGLQRTTCELLEGERGLANSLGRLQEILRIRAREVNPGSEAGEENVVQPNGHHPADDAIMESADPAAAESNTLVPPLPHISETDNLWRVTQELLQTQPQPEIQFTVTPPGAAGPSTTPGPTPDVTVTSLHRLFTCPSGLTLNSKPASNHPGLQFPTDHQMRPKHIKYNLNLGTQCRAVDDALERIMELFSDCKEYERRLEEARQRVADVARVRKRVWGVVKQRAQKEVDQIRGQ